MKKNKHIVSLFILMGLSISIFAQKGFKVIHNAEKQYANGKNKKALKLLFKAEKMNYGFYGNAWVSADRAINLLRAKIYIGQKDYQLARNSLDSIGVKYLRDNFDSIRIRTYQMEYGKDSLSKMIDTSFSNTKVECAEYNCFIIIPLMNGSVVKLKGNVELSYSGDDEKKKVEKWKAQFKRTRNYFMLIESI